LQRLSSTLSIYLAVSQTCSAITSHVLCIPQGGRGAPCRAPSRMPVGAVPQSFRAPFGRMGPSSCLAPGKRPVTAMLQMMGRRAASDCQPSPRGLQRAGWSPRTARRRRRRLCGAVGRPAGVRVLGLEDPLARRRGERSTATGLARAPGRSSHTPWVTVSGRRGLACRRLTPLAWPHRVWALPWRPVCWPSARFSAPRGRGQQPWTDRAGPRRRRGARGGPGRARVCVADRRGAVLARRRPPGPQGPQAGPGAPATAGRLWRRWGRPRSPAGRRDAWRRGLVPAHGRWRAPPTAPCGLTRGHHRAPAAGACCGPPRRAARRRPWWRPPWRRRPSPGGPGGAVAGRGPCRWRPRGRLGAWQRRATGLRARWPARPQRW
jgi:hypothetical protein